MIRALVRVIGYGFLALALSLALGLYFTFWYDYKKRVEHLRLVWGPDENVHARYLETMQQSDRFSDILLLFGLVLMLAVPGVVCLVLGWKRKAGGAATADQAANSASRRLQFVVTGVVMALAGLMLFDLAACLADPPPGVSTAVALLRETRALFSIPYAIGSCLGAAVGAATGALGASLSAESSRSTIPWRFILFVFLCTSAGVAFALLPLCMASRS